MGIRYYAYAFDAEMTEHALADPRSFISGDPLADAWGMPQGARTAVATLVQSAPATEMLYLDKAWSSLQAVTAPSEPGAPVRPAHRMFEGDVTINGYGWEPWTRALAPDEVVRIAEDLAVLQSDLGRDSKPTPYQECVRYYLRSAVEFTTQVASSNRGFAYLIG